MVFFRIYVTEYKHMFIISKKLSISKQNFAVPAASGGPYDVNVLLAVNT